MEFLHSQDTINSWAKNFAAGDQRAAERLFSYFYPLIFRYIRSRTKDEEVAIDVTQEVFLKVARSIRLYHSDTGSFSAWIWRIARNAFTDYLRSKKRSEEQTESSIGEEFSMDSFGGVTDNPEDKDDVERVMSAVDSLSEEDKELFSMRYISELSFQEIEEITGRSANALGVAMHRVRDKIKKVYDPLI